MTNILLIFGLICATGCASSSQRARMNRPETRPVPALVTIIYHVKPGAENQLKELLDRAWETYQRQQMVYDRPHICVRIKEDSEHVRFVEIFSWAGAFTAEYPSETVKNLWAQINALCEDRNGNRGMEVRSAETLLPLGFGPELGP
jgi:hypothetical protein